jgi:sigma-B regulation protein RsbU (phosphoserine phosphatase)
MMLWQANLFGRAVLNLVLRRELAAAYEALDREFEVIGGIQRSLLPPELPDIPGVSTAAHYETASRAGGDYYDFFPLSDRSWGIFIADVSGHGAAAAVIMAITHVIAHMHPGPPTPPSSVLKYLNEALSGRYTNNGRSFVTAFYGVLSPQTGMLRYSSAGHNPPRLRRNGQVAGLNGASSLPLGISETEHYEDAEMEFRPDDCLLLYTDGITETVDKEGEMFGTERLDGALLEAPTDADAVVAALRQSLGRFANGERPADDRTLVVLKRQRD